MRWTLLASSNLEDTKRFYSFVFDSHRAERQQRTGGVADLLAWYTVHLGIVCGAVRPFRRLPRS
jgi:hypothetical protein